MLGWYVAWGRSSLSCFLFWGVLVEVFVLVVGLMFGIVCLLLLFAFEFGVVG